MKYGIKIILLSLLCLQLHAALPVVDAGNIHTQLIVAKRDLLEQVLQETNQQSQILHQIEQIRQVDQYLERFGDPSNVDLELIQAALKLLEEVGLLKTGDEITENITRDDLESNQSVYADIGPEIMVHGKALKPREIDPLKPDLAARKTYAYYDTVLSESLKRREVLQTELSDIYRQLKTANTDSEVQKLQVAATNIQSQLDLLHADVELAAQEAQIRQIRNESEQELARKAHAQNSMADLQASFRELPATYKLPDSKQTLAANLNSFSSELYSMMEGLRGQLMPIAIVIVCAGFLLSIWRGSFGDVSVLLRSIAMIGIVALIIPHYPIWIEELQLLANRLSQSLGADPSKSYQDFAYFVLGDELQSQKSFDLFDLLGVASIAEILAYGVIWLASLAAAVILYFYHWAQQILLILGIATSPIYLSFLMLGPMQNVALKVILGMISVGLWSVGFAVADIVTKALLSILAKGQMQADGSSLEELSTWQFLILLMVVVAWLIISTIQAPKLISQFLTHGIDMGRALLSNFAHSVGQSITVGAGAGITAKLAGASNTATAAASLSGAGVGLFTGAIGSSGMLASAAIGMGAASAGDYTAKARQIFKKGGGE